MGTIIRYEFLGSSPVFWVLCMSGIGLPMAILYLLGNTVAVEEAVANPSGFLDRFRRGEFTRGKRP